MKAFAICYDGTEYALPSVLEWKFSYGLGSPCDAFDITCVWEPGAEKSMAGAVRLRAVHGNAVVFTGVVDEYVCVRDGAGSRLELSGRGMQGLLLDNEALPVEYQMATVKDIVDRHVTPYGIEVRGGAALGAVKAFAVTSGRSEWRVIHDFACYHNGIVPRFDRQGRLVLSAWEDKEKILLGKDTTVTRLTYGEKRYGVLSEVVVRDRSRNATERVVDQDLLRKGGRCRRVVTTTGKSDSAAMRYSGAFQLRASRAERVRCEVTVPKAFYAFPGQLVQVDRPGFGGNGIYRVAETVTGVREDGEYTELVLGETDLLV